MTLSPEDRKKRDDAIKTLAKDIGENTDALDELVHEAKAQEASAVNNEGVEAQLQFLVESWGLESTEKTVRETLGIKKQEG